MSKWVSVHLCCSFTVRLQWWRPLSLCGGTGTKKQGVGVDSRAVGRKIEVGVWVKLKVVWEYTTFALEGGLGNYGRKVFSPAWGRNSAVSCLLHILYLSQRAGYRGGRRSWLLDSSRGYQHNCLATKSKGQCCIKVLCQQKLFVWHDCMLKFEMHKTVSISGPSFVAYLILSV